MDPSRSSLKQYTINIIIVSSLFLLLLGACTSVPVSVPSINISTLTPTITASATATPTPTMTPTMTSTPTDHPGWLPAGAITRFGKGNFYDVVVSPDNDLLAIAASGGIYLADPLTGHIEDFIETNSTPLDLVFSPDGHHLYIAVGIEGVQVWNLIPSDGWVLQDILSEACGFVIAISGDGNTLLAKCFDKHNKLLTSWDISEKSQNFSLNYKTTNANFFAMAFSPIDPSLAVFTRDDIISLIDTKSGKILKTNSEPQANKITDIDFSPDGKTLAVSPYAPYVLLLDIENLEEIQRIQHKSNVFMLSFIDNDTIVSINEDSYVVQNVSGKIINSGHHSGSLPEHVYIPKYNLLVTDSYFNLDIITLDKYQVIEKIEGFHPSYWWRTDLSGDGNALFVGTAYGKDVSYSISYANNPDHFENIDFSQFCGGEAWPKLLDNAGRYIRVTCKDKNKSLIFDVNTMKVVTSQEQIDKLTGLSASIESPYSVRNSTDTKFFEIYDIQNGNIIQTIPDNAYPGTDWTTTTEISIIANETKVLVREGRFVEIYSIENGELIQKFSNLHGEDMQYFDESGNFITYYFKRDNNGTPIIFFDIYTLDSNKVQNTYSVILSDINSNDSTVNTFQNYSWFADFNATKNIQFNGPSVVFPTYGHGETAVIFSSYYSMESEMDLFKIHTVDIPNELVTKTSSYRYHRSPHLYQIGDLLFSKHDNFMLKWDFSIEN